MYKRQSFNTPSLCQGIPFDNISLTLENGLVVHAEAGDKTAELNSILDKMCIRDRAGIKGNGSSGCLVPGVQGIHITSVGSRQRDIGGSELVIVCLLYTSRFPGR